jgi:excinuclease UvrABC ATPase subunit
MVKKKAVKGQRARKTKKKAKRAIKRPGTRWSTLSAVSLRNFKRFAHLPPVSLSPLTFVTGPNNSGKSSLIQSLVLLKQSLEATTSVEQLVFDDMVKLGSFDRLMCDTASDPPDAFEICIHISLDPEQA